MDPSLVPDKYAYFTYWLVPVLTLCLLVIIKFEHTPVAAVFYVNTSFLLGTFGAYVVSNYMKHHLQGRLHAAESHFMLHALPIAVALLMLIFWKHATGKASVTQRDAFTANVLLLVLCITYCMVPLRSGEIGIKKIKRVYASENPVCFCCVACIASMLIPVCLAYR